VIAFLGGRFERAFVGFPHFVEVVEEGQRAAHVFEVVVGHVDVVDVAQFLAGLFEFDEVGVDGRFRLPEVREGRPEDALADPNGTVAGRLADTEEDEAVGAL
jgi:hypothetical protein